MKNLTESEFLFFLYAEKERLHSNFSKPGWNNWAIGGAFIALLIYLFNIITTLNLGVDWNVVLMLFISSLSITIVAIMLYPFLFPKKEIYYYNRISTFWDESPIFDLIISGLSFLIIFILLIVSSNYSCVLYIFGYLSLDRLISVCRLFYKRNRLVYSGTKYNFIPANKIGLIQIIISVGLFIFIAVYSWWNYIREFNLYLNEAQISAVFIGFWILIYIFFKTNSTPSKMLKGIDNIIDIYAYSGISQQEAMEELMYLRHGSGLNQIIKNDKFLFFSALSRLESVNTQLDTIIKTIDEGNLTSQLYYEWFKYCKKEQQNLIDARIRGANLIEKIANINKIPNDVKYSDEFKSLITLTESGVNKLTATREKFTAVLEELTKFRDAYYCNKLGSVCTNLECDKRNDKMSIIYAFKSFPIKYVLYLIVFRKR